MKPSTADSLAGDRSAIAPRPSCFGALLRGALGFGTVSVAAFAVWAFGGKWLQRQAGEAGLYGAVAVVFLSCSGLLLHGQVSGPRSWSHFYRVFLPAFLVYAAVWCAAWFLLRFGPGEWLGSLLGTAAFAIVAAWRFGNYHGLLKTCFVLFALHSAGYFAGGLMMRWIASHGTALIAGASKLQISALAKLSWGLLYGLGFGAGIAYAFQTFQQKR